MMFNEVWSNNQHHHHNNNPNQKKNNKIREADWSMESNID